MLFSRATTQKLTACLALLAVLLLFVAPVISNSRLDAPHHGSATVTLTDVSAHHHAEQGHHSTMASSHHAAAMQDEGFACGYCELLVHVALIVWAFIPFIWLTLLLERAPPIPCASAPCSPQRYAVHHPRAPPFTLR